MFQILTSIDLPYDSPAQVDPPTRGTLRIATMQTAWQGDVDKQKVIYRKAIQELRPYSPDLIILPELSLYPYACTQPDAQADFLPEELTCCPIRVFQIKMANIGSIYA
jgi:hypothetical protein